MVFKRLARATEERHIFNYLLGYRWLSLLPPFLALFLAPAPDVLLQRVLFVAVVDNLVLTLFHPRVNRWVKRRPVTLAVDLATVALFVALSGGTASLFFLYALSPLLAAAFFFRLRGALAAASTLTLFYAAALAVTAAPVDLLHALAQIISFFLIAILFGYSAILVASARRDRALLTESNAALERTNRELASIHRLALTMQSSAVDVADIQEVILTTITNSMGFERAMMALVDPERSVLIGWLAHRARGADAAPAGIFHTMEIPLRREAGVIARVILDREPAYVTDGLPPTDQRATNRRLQLDQYAILPLYMRDNPIGVLLVDNPESGAPITAESMRSLKLVADQAAIALGSTKLCIERAQRLAVEEERNRIAMEIHDTATQSLFGIVYTLDGCIKRLPENADEVQSKLVDLRSVAARTMSDLRDSVYDTWAGELTEAGFCSELQAYVRKLGAPPSLDVAIQVEGPFSRLGTFTRRNLLRIAAEGLANIVKHSGATHAAVTLDLGHSPGRLVVEDNGRGFQEADGSRRPSGMGLSSLRERARVIGAEVRIESRVGSGTRIELELPASSSMLEESQTDAHSTLG